MIRSFTSQPIAADVVDGMLETARRTPSAGNTQAVELLVLEGSDIGAYWDVTLPPDRRVGFAWPALLSAPLLVLPWVDPDAYLSRYGEPDKAPSALGDSQEKWATPYWWVDGGMTAMTLLLAAEAAGLGALFFGVFDHEAAVRECFGVPPRYRVIGAVAVGHPGPPTRAGRSADRPRRPADEVIHRGRW